MNLEKKRQIIIFFSLYARVLPSLLGLFVDVGQDVSSAAGPLTHYDWDGGAFLEVFEHSQDHIRSPLKDERHNRNTLADSYKSEFVFR